MSVVNVQTGNGRTGHGALSLLGGWLPPTTQLVVLLLLIVTIGWRTQRFRVVWLPVCLAVGAVVAVGTLLACGDSGLATDPAPALLWFWIGVLGVALALVVVGWRDAAWWRRALSAAVVPLTALCVGLVLNQWVGYYPTLQKAWGDLTAGPLPDQTDAKALARLRNTRPARGKLVGVDIPDSGSGFKHRREYVYLPPAWFAGSLSPKLPAVMMIAGEFSNPTNWIRIGNAISMIDGYASEHDGEAPVFVFVDTPDE